MMGQSDEDVALAFSKLIYISSQIEGVNFVRLWVWEIKITHDKDNNIPHEKLTSVDLPYLA